MYKSNQNENGNLFTSGTTLKAFKDFLTTSACNLFFLTHSQVSLLHVKGAKIAKNTKMLDEILKNSLKSSTEKNVITFCMLNNLWSENKESRIWRKTKTNLTKWILLSNLSVQLNNLEHNTFPEKFYKTRKVLVIKMAKNTTGSD